MRAEVRTGIYVGIAALLVAVAAATAPHRGSTGRDEDEGTLFFPDFTDPGQATSLEVYRVNERSATATVFKVQRKSGVWTIPSHHDYPADAKEKMAEAAALFIGLRKLSVRSDSRADHEALGVVDPLDAEAGLAGRGELVLFRGEGDRILGRLILGKSVEGHPDQRFLRIPESRRTYTARITSNLGVRFAEWVETDLLKLSSWDIAKLVFDNYSVDEEEGVVRPGEKIVARKDGGAWTVDGQTEAEQANAGKLDAAARALDDLKIVGVRPKPEGLTDRLETAQGFDRDMLLRSLMGRGYFLGRDRLYSNEGDLLVTTREGVRYTLRFGEIVSGDVDEASPAKDEGAGGEAGKEGEAGGNGSGGGTAGSEGGEPARAGRAETRPNRYLMVTVDLDEEALPRPEGVAIPADEVAHDRDAIREIEEIVRKADDRKKESGALPESLADAIGDDEELADDPWDRPYVYERTEDGCRVTSLGRDGQAGGEGADADIASDALDAARDRLKQADDIRAHEDKMGKARKKVADLERRFAPWYYVIDAKLFDEIRLSRADAVEPKTEEKEPGEAAPDEPGGKPPVEPGDEGK